MNFIRKYHNYILLSIPLISLLLHLHVFWLDLIGIHVWRQTETQTTINNFFRDDMNILNPRYNDHADTDRLHRMEFPLMQWLFALVYKAFGDHIIISRLLTFIIGLFSVWGIYRFIYGLSNRKEIALIGAWCFNFSPVFYYYTVNPMPDNMALCCGIWSLSLFCAFVRHGTSRPLLLSAVMLCIATLCKLPFIIYGAFMAAYLIAALLRRELSGGRFAAISGLFLLCLLPAIAWYAWVVPTWGIGVVHGISDQSRHHPVLSAVISGTLISVLPELLINYAAVLLFIAGFYVAYKKKLFRRRLFTPLAVLGLVVIAYFLFEMNMIELAHDYYLFPFLPLLFVLVAYGGEYLFGMQGYQRYLAGLCLCLLPFTAFLRINSRWDTADPGFPAAYYKYKNELRALTPPNALCVVGYDASHYIQLYYIDRKGWAFDKSWFDAGLLEHYISKGATYIFLNEDIAQQPGMSAHFGAKVFDKDGLMVYKLK